MYLELKNFQTDNTVEQQLAVIDGELQEVLLAKTPDDKVQELWDVITASFTCIWIIVRGNLGEIFQSHITHVCKMDSRDWCRRNK